MSEQTIDLDPGATPSESRVRISVLTGPHAGMSWTFDRPTAVTIGREEPSNLILRSEQALSRKHLRLEISPPTAEMIDEDSRNGTYVNGVRLAGASLRNGDRFGIGDTEMLFEVVYRETPAAKVSPAASVSPMIPTIASPSGTGGSKERQSNVRTGHPNDLKSDSGDQRLVETEAINSRPQGNSGGFFSDAGLDSEGSAQRPEPSTGDGVGSYELLQLLGRGGMASVYRAKHRRTDQLFAVKLIRNDLPQTEKQLQLFVREAGVLTQLRHPRIVKAMEFGIEGRTPYLVMEYLDTVDLLDLIDSQPIDQKIQTATWTVSKILQALHYAHEKGFVHRDVKPANILAFRKRHRLQVKLADFGLAKMYADAGFSGLTNERSVRGTVSYMAPEQFEDSRGAGPAEDVFSCGACLYRLVTGNLPNMVFGADETLKGLSHADLSEDLRDVLRKSLQLVPDQRFRSAKEFALALNGVKK